MLRMSSRLIIGLVLATLLLALAAPVRAIVCDGALLDDGCLFTATGSDTSNPADGFAVTNDDGVPLWDFVQGKDLQAIGYPISQRWVDGPFTLQAFQKVILQWDPERGRTNYYNTLDVLANRYPNVELPNVPAHRVLAADVGVGFAQVIRNHLAILDQNSRIKARFLAEPDWLNLYGLPIHYEAREVNGNPEGLQVLRTQRAVFEIWNVPAPGTTLGHVQLQNVPDKIKKLSNVIIPDSAKQPTDPSQPSVTSALDTVEQPAAASQARDIDRYFAASMRSLSIGSQSGFHNISSQPWFPDQITDREKAWIVGLFYFSDYTSYERPIEEYYFANRTLHTADGRQINVWIIREIPFGSNDDLLDRIERFVHISEDFFGLVFPTNDIIFTITNNYNYIGFGTYGAHLGSYFMLHESSLESLEHEMSHYYFDQSNTSRWLVEGGADFLAAYVNHHSGRQSINDNKSDTNQSVQEYCMGQLGIPNLHHLTTLASQGVADLGYGNCDYSFGNLFLLEILNTIGDTAMGSALNQTIGAGYGVGVQDYELYGLFLQFAPDGTKDALRDLFRRMHGGPFTTSTPEPVPFAIHEAAAPVLTEILPWAASPADDHHAEVLRLLVSLWWIDNDLMIDIARFDWLADGVNHKERTVIRDLYRIAAADVELGKLASSYDWIVDDIKHWEDWALTDLWLMVERNPGASSIVMHYSWMQDRLTFSEAYVLQDFSALIQTEHWRPADERGIAEILATLPWIADGVSQMESLALSELEEVANIERDYFMQVMAVPWIADGITSAEELASLDFLPTLGYAGPGLAKAILGLAWTADGWDVFEWQTLARVTAIFDPNQTDVSNPDRVTHLGAAVGLRLINFPWFTDGINGHELSALGGLRGMSAKDVALVDRILGFGWFSDTITDVEVRAVHHLHRITLHDLEMARGVLGSPWVADGITEDEVGRLASLAR